MNKNQKLALGLSAIMTASMALSACPGPQGNDGKNGTDGLPGIAGQNGQNALVPLQFGTMQVFLEDQTGKLDPMDTAVKFQTALQMANGAHPKASQIQAWGSFGIIIEDRSTTYSGGAEFYVVDANTFKLRYDFVSSNNASTILGAIMASLNQIVTERGISKSNQTNALRLAMDPQKNAVSPMANLGKDKDIRNQNRIATQLASRQYS